MTRLVTWIRENGGGGRGIVRARSQDSVIFWLTFCAQKDQFKFSTPGGLVDDLQKEIGNTRENLFARSSPNKVSEQGRMPIRREQLVLMLSSSKSYYDCRKLLHCGYQAGETLLEG